VKRRSFPPPSSSLPSISYQPYAIRSFYRVPHIALLQSSHRARCRRRHARERAEPVDLFTVFAADYWMDRSSLKEATTTEGESGFSIHVQALLGTAHRMWNPLPNAQPRWGYKSERLDGAESAGELLYWEEWVLRLSPDTLPRRGLGQHPLRHGRHRRKIALEN
jgi:hypothetical protein